MQLKLCGLSPPVEQRASSSAILLSQPQYTGAFLHYTQECWLSLLCVWWCSIVIVWWYKNSMLLLSFCQVILLGRVYIQITPFLRKNIPESSIIQRPFFQYLPVCLKGFSDLLLCPWWLFKSKRSAKPERDILQNKSCPENISNPWMLSSYLCLPLYL